MPSLLSRVLLVPTVGGADCFARANQPLGAGLAQIALNNAHHLLAENSLRHLMTYPGPKEVWTNSASNAEFPWDRYYDSTDGTGGGVLVVATGPIVLRKYGDSGLWPKVTWKFRWHCGDNSGTKQKITIVTQVARWGEHPRNASYSLQSTTYNDSDTTFVTASLTTDLGVGLNTQSVPFNPAQDPAESGTLPIMRAWAGFYCEANNKSYSGEVAGVACYLEENP